MIIAIAVAVALLVGLLILERSRADAVRRLRVTQERLRKGIALAPTGVVTLDADGRFVEVNEAFCRMLARAPEDLVGLHVAEVTHPDDVESTLDSTRRLSAGELETYTVEKRYLRPDGSVVWASVAGSALPALEGRGGGIFSLVEDLTERKRAEERLHEMARTDELTGLPNRKELIRRLEEALARARRSGRHLGVLFLDLDRFKDANDHLGHHVGDRLLQAIAERLRAVVRPTDVVSRFGGDEFVFVLDDLTRPEEAVEVAGRVLTAVAEPVTITGMRLIGTGSIGVAHTSGEVEGIDAATLIQQADIAMYRAKRSGRGQVEVFDDTLRHELRRRYSLEHRLGEAVEGDELHLVYQPIVSLHTGVITAVEALLRWEHPDGTFASPAEFIPIAEETGSIRAVGAWVAAEACRQAAEWEQLGVEPIPVHINVSAVQLRSRSFVEMLRSALSEAGVAPTRMCVELTETVLLDDLERTLERLTALAELGVGIAIDDFGTGYSSLGYLQRFPADLLKIDRSLIATMADDAADIIAEMTVSLAHALNLELVAEGIEAAWQAERVRDLGYHRAQGFHFGHPQAAAELGPQLPRRSGERPRADEVPIVSFQSYCALEQHPAVHMAAAIEVADRGGAEVMAFVVMNPGAPPIAPDALAAWCEERLPAFAIPRYYTVVDRLPKGPSERSSPRRLREWSRSLPTWDRRAGGMRQPITP